MFFSLWFVDIYTHAEGLGRRFSANPSWKDASNADVHVPVGPGQPPHNDIWHHV